MNHHAVRGHYSDGSKTGQTIFSSMEMALKFIRNYYHIPGLESPLYWSIETDKEFVCVPYWCPVKTLTPMELFASWPREKRQEFFAQSKQAEEECNGALTAPTNFNKEFLLNDELIKEAEERQQKAKDRGKKT